MNKVLLGELPIADYVTHTFDGLDKVNELVHTMHEGACLRGVVSINEFQVPANQENIKVIKSQRFFGGSLKTVTHWSAVNNCEMTFMIFLPDCEVREQRREPYPALYFLAGLTCNWENAPTKSGFAAHAKKRNIAMVFPDTSPRGVDATCPEAG